MSKALIAGINQVATDKGLDREVIFEAIEAALISAYKRNYGSVANVTSEVDRVSGDMRVFAEREVVEEVFNERTEITQEDAKKRGHDVELGDVIKVDSQPDNFGRIAAQTAKQVILQRIREAERDTVYENFAHRVNEILSAQVRSVDPGSGVVTVLLDEKYECLLMRDDQIRNENLRRGDFVKVYVSDVHRSNRGPVIKISRTHRNLLRRLMEQEIPEIRDGIVEIKAISREPGARSKAAVVSTVEGVDPVGSCVGMRGLRIQNIVNELNGEKIDVVEWDADVIKYISNALSPAKVTNVLLDDSNSIKTAVVIVPDRQLSLAIGKAGQNARLAAKLTGWRIDIKSESESIAEGLDKRIADQSAANASGTDLLAYAEQLLRDQDESSPTEDKFAAAARKLEEMSAADEESNKTLDLPSLADLPEEDPLPTPKISLEDAASAIESEQQEFIEEFPVFDSADIESNLAPVPLSEPEEDGAEQEEPVAGEDVEEDLPQVITADMLKSRKAEIDFDSPDFEIPEEMLVGLQDDEFDEESSSKKSKKKKKSNKKAKKPRQNQSQTEEDDEFADFF